MDPVYGPIRNLVKKTTGGWVQVSFRGSSSVLYINIQAPSKPRKGSMWHKALSYSSVLHFLSGARRTRPRTGHHPKKKARLRRKSGEYQLRRRVALVAYHLQVYRLGIKRTPTKVKECKDFLLDLSFTLVNKPIRSYLED